MIQNVYYFLCGYLYVKFIGNNVKRLLNLCAQNSITLWDITYISEKESDCRILWKDIYRLAPHLRKTKTKIKIIEKKGLPYQRIRFRKRYLYFISILLLIFIMYIFSKRIWKIEILGNTYVSDEEMLRFLKQQHIGYNSVKDTIDCSKVELELRKQIEDIIWASVYIEGTKLVVEVQESIATENECKNLQGPKNVVATKDAVIASITTRRGVPQVVKGQLVKANEILVSSAYPIVNDDESVERYVYQSADADIKGYVTYEYEDTLPISEVIKEPTGNKYSCYQWRIGTKSFKSPTFRNYYSDYQIVSNTTQLRLFDNFYLPVFQSKNEYYELKDVTCHYSQKSAKEILTENFCDFLYEMEENGVLIISKNVIMEKKGEIYYMHGTIQTCEDIAKDAPADKIPDISQEDTKN